VIAAVNDVECAREIELTFLEYKPNQLDIVNDPVEFVAKEKLIGIATMFSVRSGKRSGSSASVP
jgi:hypothetical protein